MKSHKQYEEPPAASRSKTPACRSTAKAEMRKQAPMPYSIGRLVLNGNGEQCLLSSYTWQLTGDQFFAHAFPPQMTPLIPSVSGTDTHSPEDP